MRRRRANGVPAGTAGIGLSLLILALAPSGREVEPLAVPDVATTT